MATRVRLGTVGTVAALCLFIGGCGIGASGTVVTFPPSSIGPAATVSPAVAQTRAAIAAAVAPSSLQLEDAKRPFRPPESASLASAPRAVFQVLLPADPDGGNIVVYEFRDSTAAVDAGNELAGYIGTGAGRIQFPPDAQHTIRELGTTLIVYSWSPSNSPDPGSKTIAEALASIGIGFAPPR
jgi:hypothetical protein